MVTSKLKVRKASVITLFSITCNFLTRERGYKLYHLYACFHSFVKRKIRSLFFDIVKSLTVSTDYFNPLYYTFTGLQLQRLQGHSSGGQLLYFTGFHIFSVHLITLPCKFQG